MVKDTLKLVLKQKWFDLIDSGEKKEEYRSVKPFWNNYFVKDDELITYKRVVFYMGYSKDRPSMTFKIDGIRIGRGKPEWGAELGVDYFVIQLGERE